MVTNPFENKGFSHVAKPIENKLFWHATKPFGNKWFPHASKRNGGKDRLPATLLPPHTRGPWWTSAGILDFNRRRALVARNIKVDVLSSWVCSTVVGTHDGETFRRLETFCRHGDGIHASSPKTFHRSGYAAKRSHVVGFWS